MRAHVDCWCISCEATVAEARVMNGELGLLMRTFIACPLCGNKRCPRATHHDNACTRSNEMGQPGSAYGDWRKS